MEATTPATKTLDQYWIDWESYAFGYGYGSGEEHVIPALKAFLGCCEDNTHGSFNYDFRIIEKSVGPIVTWLFINTLCKLDILEYGTSPRFGWLTKSGAALKEYMDKTDTEKIVELVTKHSDGDAICHPEYCNCESVTRCVNPFWG